jgi:choline dehydrogenase
MFARKVTQTEIFTLITANSKDSSGFLKPEFTDSYVQADPLYNGTAGRFSRIFAKKEVIIAGGTFNSPQILKLSGIGPAKELKKFHIPVVKDLPGVGENLGDNYEAGIQSLASRPLNGSAGPISVFLKTPTARKTRNIQAWCASFSFEGFWPGFPTDYGPSEYEVSLLIADICPFS